LYIHDEENKTVFKPAPGHHSIDDVTPDEWNKVK